MSLKGSIWIKLWFAGTEINGFSGGVDPIPHCYPLSPIIPYKRDYVAIYKTHSNLTSSNGFVGFVTISISDIKQGQSRYYCLKVWNQSQPKLSIITNWQGHWQKSLRTRLWERHTDWCLKEASEYHGGIGCWYLVLNAYLNQEDFVFDEILWS